MIGCVHQTRPRNGTRHSANVSHTLSDHHICHGVRLLGHHVKNGSFLHQAWISCQWTEVFYHLNKMLVATKHIADNNFIIQYLRQRTGTSSMQHIPNLSTSLSLTYDRYSVMWYMKNWWTPLIIRFRESYNSMSMSCKSTSLKKSSSIIPPL